MGYHQLHSMGVLNALVSKLFCLMCMYAIGSVLSEDSEDGYGTEWLRYFDDNGTARTMNFSVLPEFNDSWKNGYVHFYLYTRDNSNDPETLQIPENGSHLNSQYYNASRNTKVLTHGWLSSGNVDWIQNQKTNYLQGYDLNVIVVDWQELADNPVYPWSACCTRFVGKQLAKLLDSLVESYQATGEQMHLIGHSLGAQVMGYAGMFFSETLFRITGLDPARPLFEIPQMSDDWRLDKSDATFVDIIHTAAGTYGYQDSHGQADFYPNGGKSPQPGCEGPLDRADSCSHGRSHEYFTESIQDGKPFTSYPCDSYEGFDNGECKTNSTSMGNFCDKSAYGNYYLHTRNQTPYAIGEEY